MGRKDENYHAQTKVEVWEHLLGYVVEDASGARIGTLKALWEDFTRRPAYMGVATSWLDLGRIHVVPAQYASISERSKRIRLPFTAATVKHAPEGHAKAEITLRGETKIRDYFHGKVVEGALDTLNQGPQARSAPLARPMRPEAEPTPDWRPRPDPEAFEIMHEDVFADEGETGTGNEPPRSGLRKIQQNEPKEPKHPNDPVITGWEAEAEPGVKNTGEQEERFIPMRDIDSDANRRHRLGDADRDKLMR